ncbi:MAG: T9SS type B sorting domain-containing protein [Aequorivita sp.]
MKRLLLIFIFIFPLFVFSQENQIELFQQFNGRYSFTAIGNTLNAAENNEGYCDMLSQSSATLNLEPGQTLVSAHLYWASIGPGDFDVGINGTPITADRTIDHMRNGLPYFSAYADVTDIVAATGNDTYTFSGLDVMDLLPDYCGTNFGGWAIYIIYEDPSLLLNQISLFDGLKGVASAGFPMNLTLTNINVTSDQFSKIGFLAWEGDQEIAVGESLYLNGQLTSDPPLNPANNAFNGTNSYIGPPENAQNYNMDLDYYDMIGVVEPGDTTIHIKLTSNQDWILVNNVIVSVNSELPDATISFDNIDIICEGQNIDVNYTVANFNSTAILPANVPIAFYADTDEDSVLLGQTQTINIIPREGTESGTINLDIPTGTPQVFTLRAVVDEDNEFPETNEDNNEFEQEIDVGLPQQDLLILGNNQSCDGETEILTANLDNLDVYEWFLDGSPYGGNTPTIEVTQSGIYTVSGYLGACFLQESPGFNMEFEPSPTVNETPDPLIACDSDSDGFTEFFLHNADEDIIGDDPNLMVTYHYTLLDAQNNQNELENPFPNILPYNDEVYARVEVTNSSCYATVLLKLEVRDSPVLTDPEPYSICDDNNDGYEIFDLTTKEDEILNGLDPLEYDLYYYSVEQDAIDAGDSAIDNPDFSEAITNISAYQNETQNTQIIYVLAVGSSENTTPNNGAEGCYDIVELELIVGPLPVGVEPDDYHLCDDTLNGSTVYDQISTFDLTSRDSEITEGDPELQVSWFETMTDEEADTPILDPSQYQNTSNAQTIVARVYNGFECKDLVTLTLVVDPVPTPVVPTRLYGCDLDNDGIADFDLDSKTVEIQGGDPDLIVTYHETLTDAESGDSPLSSPYENTVLFNQIIFVRAAFGNSPAGTDCYAIVELELEVVPTPEVPQDLPDLTACDDDETYEFDLTQQEDLIYGNQSHDDYTLTYHLTENDAIAGNNAIAQPETYTNVTNPQTIWVRLAHNETECYKVSSFDLVINSGLPIIDPEPFVKCDDLGEPFDGVAIFDLTEKNAEITDGVLTLDVSYFADEADAQNNENPIAPDTAYENMENPQVVYVRVTDSNTDCISFTTLTLKVVSNPEPIIPDSIELCDVTVIIPPGPYDEVEIFDLTSREAQIQNGNNWDITYFESYDDAVNQEDAIPAAETTAYQNTSNPQIIYVRATNPDSECFETVELELIVNPLPDDSAEISDYIICAADNSEIGVFNLETKAPEILGDQTDPPYEVNFYLNQTDAEDQINAIVNTTSHQNKDANNNAINPQTIYVGITNTETGGCYIGGAQSFDLIVQQGAIAVAPAEPFVICDNLPPLDGYAEFNLDDLTDQQVADLHAEILAGQDPTTFGITFHETLDQAEAGIDALSFPYVNITNPQVIYVRVTNNDSQYEPKCYAVVEMTIEVESLPEVLLDDQYRLCVDENGNPIPEEEGGMSPPVIDTGLDPALFTFVWELNGVIIPGETSPSIIALESGEYTVTYTELASNCENSVNTTVFISSPPYTYNVNVTSDAFDGNQIIEVTATGEGTYNYQLDNGPFQESGTFENVSPGTHTVTIKDIYGCGSVTVEVSVIDYPPFFTPNEDGYHDTWNIIGIGEFDPVAKIYIFDRFGKLLKQLSPFGPGWDGTYIGNPMPSSDYWFRVEYTEDGNAKEFKGHFTLKR